MESKTLAIPSPLPFLIRWTECSCFDCFFLCFLSSPLSFTPDTKASFPDLKQRESIVCWGLGTHSHAFNRSSRLSIPWPLPHCLSLFNRSSLTAPTTWLPCSSYCALSALTSSAPKDWVLTCSLFYSLSCSTSCLHSLYHLEWFLVLGSYTVNMCVCMETPTQSNPFWNWNSVYSHWDNNTAK